jgi:hypothetical protein
MQININDDLIKKLKEQADDKDLSEIVAHAIEFFLTCSEVEATSAEHPKKPFKMIKGGAYDGLFNSVIKHGLWDEK